MENKMNNLNIRTKITAATVAAVIVIISIIGFYSFNLSWNLLLKKTFENELPAVLGEVNNDLNSQFNIPVIASRTISKSPLFLEYENDTSAEYISRYLKDIKKEYNAINSFFVAEKDGNYYTPEGIVKQIKRSNPNDQWFYENLKDDNSYNINFDIDTSTNIPTMFVNYKVIKNNKKIGVAGIGLSLENVTNLIKDYKIGESGFVYIADKNGKIQLHPDKSFLNKNIEDLFDLKLDNILSGNKISIKEIEINNNEQVIGIQTIDSLGWILVAQISKEEVLSDLDGYGTTLLIMAIIVAALFIPISMFALKRLLLPFDNVANLLEDIGNGQGDLTKRLDDTRDDEAGKIAKGYNNFVITLSDLLKDIAKTEKEMTNIIQDLNTVSSTMETDVKEQSSQIDQIATAIHEIGATSNEISENANQAASASNEASNAIDNGKRSISSTLSNVNVMNNEIDSTQLIIKKLEEDAQNINTVLSVITGVSEQTNLLALNAAIEAARAGEQGRGFAVVADEVRTLAAKTNNSADEINDIIKQLHERTNAVVEAIEKNKSLALECNQSAIESNEDLESISKNISDMNDQNIQIASATTEQSQVINEIAPHITEVSEIAKSIEVIAEGSNEECKKLLTKSKNLTDYISKFKF
jgi:methyl-accepting chemotaxis protein